MEHLLVLVNEKDEQIGLMEKMEVHRKALLHRAFSVFIFNAKGEMLLQQRALSKYHSGGLWTNACCSHPAPEETPSEAAKRRLTEELGFTTEVQPAFQFTYKAKLDNELTEYEFDHVFIGKYDGSFNLNAKEVASVAFVDMGQLRNEINMSPEKYTAWFLIAFPLLEEYMREIS